MEDEIHIEAEPDENPQVLQNQNPAFLVSTFMTGKLFIEEYGWFLLFGFIILMLLFNWLQPYFARWLQKREDKAYYCKYDASKFQETFEAMQRVREKMQEENNTKTEIFIQQEKEREEKKRQQRLEKRGEKFSNQSLSSETKESKPKPKPKSKSSLNTEYLPMAGSSGGTTYRPSRRYFSGG